MMAADTRLLEVRDLHASIRSDALSAEIIRGISFSVAPAETVGLVGESGSGKSITALSLMGLLPAGFSASGTALLHDEAILDARPARLRQLRGAKMAMVFQDAFSALNPTMSLGHQIAESLRLHKSASRAAARDGAIDLLRSVGIPSADMRYHQYPHEISGGQRQRVLIAVAFACSPTLLLADEPTTALDVTIQAEILELLGQMQRKHQTGVLLITHDLGVVAQTCDRVLVMYAGRIVESAPVAMLFANPKHPYTQGLLAAVPDVRSASRIPKGVPGRPPEAGRLPQGCPFHTRCPKFMPGLCDGIEPGPSEPEAGVTVRCYLYGE